MVQLARTCPETPATLRREGRPASAATAAQHVRRQSRCLRGSGAASPETAAASEAAASAPVAAGGYGASPDGCHVAVAAPTSEPAPITKSTAA